jgi:hypothetical protein
MNKPLLFFAASVSCLALNAQTIVETEAYKWIGDTIRQDKYAAWATNENEIVSTYAAQPGFFMPISQKWNLKNDISSYPRLVTPNKLHTAIYNMGLDEMVNAVEPDTTLRTGKEWAGVWTRDVSYSIILSMAYMQPLASKVSLMKKVSPRGRIIQDTGSGGAWPVSSDRMIWAVAAYELYKVTGERSWLEYIYPVIRDSMDDDFATLYGESGLVRGETSFIDWREQSYPRWMQTADIYQSEALGTSIVHVQALKVLHEIATILGKKAEAKNYEDKANQLADAINKTLWLDDKGYYAMYRYGRDHLITNPRAESLGESLSILFDVASKDRAESITRNNPTTPFGVAIFYPQIADMTAYHNNSLWPWVAAYWALANAKVGNEQGVLEAIGSIYRPAALFTTNKENFRLDNGDIATELNSSNMLWCLAGNIAITHRILFGINFDTDGLRFSPFVPKELAAERRLENFKYRNAILNITIKGYGNKIKSFTVNGKEQRPFIPTNAKGVKDIVITMADNDIAPLGINHVKNASAPLTPIAWLSNSPELNGKGVPTNNLLQWNPIEYIDHYVIIRDGVKVSETRMTQYPATIAGEYQVIGVSSNGIESFASQPASNVNMITVELPNETTQLLSSEVSYRPTSAIEGYHGKGFTELDHNTSTINVEVEIPQSGTYAISAVYANGNGPVNTENKCAIRTISVDNERLGIIVMPQRGVGNWNDWGNSSSVQTLLTAGKHTIAIEFRSENENMNLQTNHAIIDRILVRKVK